MKNIINYKKTNTYKSFLRSKYYSLKYSNYFHIYDELFSKYKNKKIIFVEIGVFSGGSLFAWRNFFGKKAKIIGIDLNPSVKKFEKYGFKIFIGDQSNKNFWEKFFSKVGKVDVVLDDGGHTNYQQIMTTNCCIPNIKDNGTLVVEDVHTSFLKNKWYNPSKYSYVNYTKKLIDDINSRFPGLEKHNYSLRKYIYSIKSYESIISYNINRKMCKDNILISNKGKSINPKELRSELDKNSILFKMKKFFKIRSNFTYLVFLINSIKLKKFFK